MDSNEKNTKLGWIGLGVMGEPMCQHLLAAGYAVSVFSRSAEKAERVLSQGASWCESPQQVVQSSDVIFTMVGSAAEVEQVYFSETGLFHAMDSATAAGKIFIDMGTTAPNLTKRIASQATLAQAHLLDAPVSGGDVGARNATLSIMVGGDKNIVESVQPLFNCLGSALYMGESGSGQHTKMCNQITVAGTMIGVCEALLYGEKSGLDCEKMLQAIRPGAAGCWTLDNLAPRMLNNDFETGFMVDHFIKDLGIALSEAKVMQLDLPGLTLANALYCRVNEMGHGKSATQALLLALQEQSLGNAG